LILWFGYLKIVLLFELQDLKYNLLGLEKIRNLTSRGKKTNSRRLWILEEFWQRDYVFIVAQWDIILCKFYESGDSLDSSLI
jgi:hypothetical protein